MGNRARSLSPRAQSTVNIVRVAYWHTTELERKCVARVPSRDEEIIPKITVINLFLDSSLLQLSWPSASDMFERHLQKEALKFCQPKSGAYRARRAGYIAATKPKERRTILPDGRLDRHCFKRNRLRSCYCGATQQCIRINKKSCVNIGQHIVIRPTIQCANIRRHLAFWDPT